MTDWLDLGLILPAVGLMEDMGVSRVARSRRGFLTAYVRARGDRRRLGLTPRRTPNRDPYPWAERRAEFVARHLAQARRRGERWWTDRGTPTRRHLALVAWAYSPTPARWRRYVRGLDAEDGRYASAAE